MPRAVMIACVALAVMVGAVVTAFLASSLYLSLLPPTCKDVIHPGGMPACSAPASPLWLLVITGVVGGGIAGAVGRRILP